MADAALFKTGLLVIDLESAMRDLGCWLGLSWTPVQESPLALATESAALARAGLPCEAAGIGADGATPALFAFHRGAHGVRIELVDAANRVNFQTWLAGGALDLGSLERH